MTKAWVHGNRLTAGLHTLQIRVVPTMAIVQQRIFVPQAQGLVASNLAQEVRGAGKWPVQPAFDVTVPNRVVMDVFTVVHKWSSERIQRSVARNQT